MILIGVQDYNRDLTWLEKFVLRRTMKVVKELDVMSSHLWADGEISSRPPHFQYQDMNLDTFIGDTKSTNNYLAQI